MSRGRDLIMGGAMLDDSDDDDWPTPARPVRRAPGLGRESTIEFSISSTGSDRTRPTGASRTRRHHGHTHSTASSSSSHTDPILSGSYGSHQSHSLVGDDDLLGNDVLGVTGDPEGLLSAYDDGLDSGLGQITDLMDDFDAVADNGLSGTVSSSSSSRRGRQPDGLGAMMDPDGALGPDFFIRAPTAPPEFQLQRILKTERNQLGDSLFQAHVRGGEVSILVSEDNKIHYWGRAKHAKYPIRSREVIQNVFVSPDIDATHILVITRESVYYINTSLRAFAPKKFRAGRWDGRAVCCVAFADPGPDGTYRGEAIADQDVDIVLDVPESSSSSSSRRRSTSTGTESDPTASVTDTSSDVPEGETTVDVDGGNPENLFASPTCTGSMLLGLRDGTILNVIVKVEEAEAEEETVPKKKKRRGRRNEEEATALVSSRRPTYDMTVACNSLFDMQDPKVQDLLRHQSVGGITGLAVIRRSRCRRTRGGGLVRLRDEMAVLCSTEKNFLFEFVGEADRYEELFSAYKKQLDDLARGGVVSSTATTSPPSTSTSTEEPEVEGEAAENAPSSSSSSSSSASGVIVQNFFRRIEVPRSSAFSPPSDVYTSQLFVQQGDRLNLRSFAWLSSAGIYHGRIGFPSDRRRKVDEDEDGSSSSSSSILRECELIDVRSSMAQAAGSSAHSLAASAAARDDLGQVISIATFEFYIAVLFEKKLMIYLCPPDLCASPPTPSDGSSSSSSSPHAIVPLSEIKIAYEHRIVTENGRPLGMFGELDDTGRNPVLFMYTDLNVYQILPDSGYEKPVWRLYLNKAVTRSVEVCFRIAEKLVRDLDLDERHKNTVLKARAQYYYDKGSFERAAKIFASTTGNFEEVAILFSAPQMKDPLRVYLLMKLQLLKEQHHAANEEESVSDSDEEMDSQRLLKKPGSTQLCCLCTWIAELYLEKMNQLWVASGVQRSDAVEAVRREFRRFIIDNVKYLHKETTFQLISSHGRMSDLIFFAQRKGEIDFVLEFFITKKRFDRALAELENRCDVPRKAHYWYRFAPILMEHLPQDLLHTLQNPDFDFLEPALLLPALMRYVSKFATDVLSDMGPDSLISYLKWCIFEQREDSPTVHNLLLYLYAQLRDEDYLLDFLQDPEMHYEVEYALRVCVEHDKTQACIYLYSQKLKLYEDAVLMCLEANDVEKAKSITQMADLAGQWSGRNQALARTLWLRIAKYVIQRSVKESLDLLTLDTGEPNHCLKFEDLLPMFPDTVSMDDFKGEICKSLNAYNADIDSLKTKMRQQSRDLETIRHDIKRLKLEYHRVHPQSTRCYHCNLPLFPQPFYLFPCGHRFHRGCLSEVRDSLIPFASPHALEPQEGEEDPLISEDITAECPCCGVLMVGSIDAPFLNSTPQDRADLREWSVSSIYPRDVLPRTLEQVERARAARRRRMQDDLGSEDRGGGLRPVGSEMSDYGMDDDLSSDDDLY